MAIIESTATVSIRVSEKNQIGEARRVATAVAGGLGFSPEESGKVSIVVTEVANNLVKHTHGGELLIRPLEWEGISGVEVLSLDNGPGMADVNRCMEDGFSTAGSPGTGLGAMARLSSLFDVYSHPGVGTVALIRFWLRPPPERGLPVRVGGVSVPSAGEAACGDAWAALQAPDRTVLLVADGLGHGEFAAEAAAEAVRVFRQHPDLGPVEMIELAHGALRGTRGAALAVAELTGGEVRYAGIGNIAATILSQGASRSLISYNGIVGHQMRKNQKLRYPWSQDAVLIMSSDGLKTRWSLDHCPGIELHHPALAAAALYRDYKRERDDVTVVVCRAIL